MSLAEPLPVFIAPMLLRSTTTVPDAPGWALEVDADGARSARGPVCPAGRAGG
jgi:ATP-dependent DNA ligase